MAPVLFPGVVTFGLYAQHPAANTVRHLCTAIRSVPESMSALRPGPTDYGASGEFQAQSTTDDDKEQPLPYSQTQAARAG